MTLGLFRKRRAVGLDIGGGAVKALCLEVRRSGVAVTGRASRRVGAEADAQEIAGAIHGALVDAGVEGEPVVTAVGGPDVVIRHVSLPRTPANQVVSAIETQHRELGLLPPSEAVTDAQVLRPSRDGLSSEVLSVSVSRARIDERLRLLELARVTPRILDVEPLALLNAAIDLTALDDRELLVLLAVGRRRSALCLYSERGPVVARHLDVGAETLAEQIRGALGLGADVPLHRVPPERVVDAEGACRPSIERMVEEVRLSLASYRSEHDRGSVPRYAIGGCLDVPWIGQWIADRLGLREPPQLLDPFKAVEVSAPAPSGIASGPEFLQAFGLALRAL